jgi:ABC-type transporter Mla MlaB component
MSDAPKKKASKKKAKLGHDPLAWISDDDVATLKNEVGSEEVKVEQVKFDDVELPVEDVQPEEIVVDKEQEEEVMSEQTIFELPPYFGIAQVAVTKESMQAFLQNSTEEIEIEAEDVESIDTAALQLLLSFIKEAKLKNKSIKWKSMSDKLEGSIELLAIKEDLAIG